jgi:predicted alpha-1,6-mannanase (GH76 family)
LIRALQHPPNFRLTSGSYPQACEWTSTVIATILIDYCHQTADNQYFPDFVAFHRHQPVCHLITQKNDDKLWVVMTYLRGAAYAAGRNEKLRAKFLKRAKFFYYQAKWGWDDSTCGGGMYWGQCSRYKNAVTIELYITVSIRMYEVFGEEWMLAAALRGWVWFQQSGMINAEGLVNDGLDDNGRYLDSFSGSS